MAIYRCKMCGGDLNVQDETFVTICDSCGTQQTVPVAKDEALQGLYNRANTLRLKCEFDRAEQLYEKILQRDETQSEAYWGMILSRYGIEYVEDPATFSRKPTCHRISYDPVIADADYKSALRYASVDQIAVLEAQAAEIDRIQKEILALAKTEADCDVFICYKETDEYGKRSQDSVIANDIYYQLNNEGFRVFYAPISLEDKLGSSYEPCIFTALNSAKVMLAIGTKPFYFNSVWVRNEWSRFLKLMKQDRSRLLIPCYKDMDAYELPDEFAHLQAQDMGKIGFVSDLIRGIKKVISPVQAAVLAAPKSTASQLFLESGVMYEGESFAGVPHGFGKGQLPNGDIYEGNWNRGVRTGQGTLTRPDGKQWTGHFEDGKPQTGSGVLQMKVNGHSCLYDGELKSGKRYGQGVLTWQDEKQWKGLFQEDIPWDGQGTLHPVINSKLCTYSGELKSGRRHGQGKLCCDDFTYEGQFSQGQRHGQGTLTHKDGSQWTGEFRNDQPWEGTGTLDFVIDKISVRYEGQLQYGLRHGQGILHYINAVYEGQFAQGKRHGQGTMKWNKGGQWTGEYQEDCPWNGSGVLYPRVGVCYEGPVVNGYYCGFGRLTMSRVVYEGEFENNKRHGQGMLTWNKGGQWVGQFHEDIPWNGSGRLYRIADDEEFWVEGNFREGKLSGHGKLCRKEFLYEGQFTEGRIQGQGVLTWNKMGQWEGQFQDGKPWNGVGRVYYTANNKEYWMEGSFQNGKLYGNGRLCKEEYVYNGQFVDGQCQGEGVMHWNKGGQWSGYFQAGTPWSGFGRLYRIANNKEFWIEGNIQNGKMNGNGTICKEDYVYKGQVAEDNLHGQGIIIWNKGGQFQGKFVMGRPWNGTGVWYTNGNRQEGRWIEGRYIDGRLLNW